MIPIPTRLQQHVTAVIAASCVAVAVLSPARAADEPALDPGQAVGALMALPHAAAAFRAECAPYLPPGDLARTFDGWQARNQPMVERVIASGRAAAGSPTWERQQSLEASTVRDQVAMLIRPAPLPSCRRALGEFDDGTYDLSHFPEPLKVLRLAP